MERFGNFLGGDDDNVVRQKRLQSTPDVANRNTTVGREIGNLSQRMDAGIGASGTVHPLTFAGKPFDGVFNTFLNRQTIWLHLPASVICPVVGDREHNVSMCPGEPFTLDWHVFNVIVRIRDVFVRHVVAASVD